MLVGYTPQSHNTQVNRSCTDITTPSDSNLLTSADLNITVQLAAEYGAVLLLALRIPFDSKSTTVTNGAL